MTAREFLCRFYHSDLLLHLPNFKYDLHQFAYISMLLLTTHAYEDLRTTRGSITSLITWKMLSFVKTPIYLFIFNSTCISIVCVSTSSFQKEAISSLAQKYYSLGLH